MQEHTLVSKLAYITILLQPFVLSAGLFMYASKKDSLWRSYLLCGIMFISLLQAFSASYYAFVTNRSSKWLSQKGPHCHLVWWFSRNKHLLPVIAQVDVIYFMSIILAVLLIKPLQHALIYTFITLSSYAITSLYYPTETGTLWCWIANLLALLTIFL